MKTAYLMQKDTIEFKFTFSDDGIEMLSLEKFVNIPRWSAPKYKLERGNKAAYNLFSAECWHPNYVLGKGLLFAFGLSVYDPYQIARKTFAIRDVNPCCLWIWFEEDYPTQPLWADVCELNRQNWSKVEERMDLARRLGYIR